MAKEQKGVFQVGPKQLASGLRRHESGAGDGAWRGPLREAPVYAPAYLDYDYLASGVYESDAGRVDVVVQTYAAADKELVNALNAFADGEAFDLVSTGVEVRAAGSEEWRVTRNVIRGKGRTRVTLSWFQVGERRATGTFGAKINETLGRIGGAPVPRSLVTLSAVVEESDERSEPLADFVARFGQQLVECVARPDSGGCVAGAEE